MSQDVFGRLAAAALGLPAEVRAATASRFAPELGALAWPWGTALELRTPAALARSASPRSSPLEAARDGSWHARHARAALAHEAAAQARPSEAAPRPQPQVADAASQPRSVDAGPQPMSVDAGPQPRAADAASRGEADSDWHVDSRGRRITAKEVAAGAPAPEPARVGVQTAPGANEGSEAPRTRSVPRQVTTAARLEPRPAAATPRWTTAPEDAQTTRVDAQAAPRLDAQAAPRQTARSVQIPELQQPTLPPQGEAPHWLAATADEQAPAQARTVGQQTSPSQPPTATVVQAARSQPTTAAAAVRTARSQPTTAAAAVSTAISQQTTAAVQPAVSPQRSTAFQQTVLSQPEEGSQAKPPGRQAATSRPTPERAGLRTERSQPTTASRPRGVPPPAEAPSPSPTAPPRTSASQETRTSQQTTASARTTALPQTSASQQTTASPGTTALPRTSASQETRTSTRRTASPRMSASARTTALPQTSPSPHTTGLARTGSSAQAGTPRRASQSDEERPAAEADSEPRLELSIGKIIVQADPPQPQARRTSQAPTPRLSLDQYLRLRARQRRTGAPT